jgi:hypothetical protein
VCRAWLSASIAGVSTTGIGSGDAKKGRLAFGCTTGATFMARSAMRVR